MKRKYKELPYCTKHQLRHGQKYPSCPIEVKTTPTGAFDITLPGGTRVNFRWTGKHFSAKDIQNVYKLLKLQHYYV